MANNRVCKVCGKEYEYCPSCPKDRNKKKFMIMFCGDNCHDIFNTCSAFNMNMIDKDEAKSKLMNLDISNKKRFTKQIQNDIDNIMKQAIRKESVFKERADIVVE